MTLDSRAGVVALAILFMVVAGLTWLWNSRTSLNDVVGVRGSSFLTPPDYVFREWQADLVDPAMVPDESRSAQLRAAAKRDPLSDEAFLLAAYESLEKSRFREALGLLETARLREPRNRITRLLLLSGYLREARAEEVVSEALVLQQLRAGNVQSFLPVLVGLAEEASTRDLAINRLGASPLGISVMRALANEQVDPAIILSFPGTDIDLENPSEEDRAFVAGIVTPYQRAQDWTSAIELFAHFYGADDLVLSQLTDPEFSGVPGAPFGWELRKSGGGIAEFGDGALTVLDFGRENWTVAQQTILLAPGTYEMSVNAGGGKGGAADLAWEVQCAGSKQILLSMPLRPDGFLGLEPETRFTVPESGCVAQYIQLISRARSSQGSREMQVIAPTLTAVGPE